MGLRSTVLALGGALAMLAGAAAPAGADTTTSSNWSGYAVHGRHSTFKRVIGAWTEPSATCVAGQATYSAIWVGIGGYSESSDALEQIGTEIDCTASGRVRSSAWYELVPATSRSIAMTVSPGDKLAASVIVSGHRVTLALQDTTTHRTFNRTLTAAQVDTSSAEWIVEAPSECASSSSCVTLPLADFGTTGFTLAEAVNRHGHTGTVTDSDWDETRITLLPSAPARFVSDVTSSATATASALADGGSAFSVTYATGSGPGQFATVRRAAVNRAGGRLR